MANMDKKSENGFSIDKIISFCKDNVRYISGGVLVVALVVALAITTGRDSGEQGTANDKAASQDTQTPEDNADGEDVESSTKQEKADEHPEVTTLMSTYYNSYAVGDLDKLSSIARKLSDMEKDYIKMLNEHVESYGDVSCTVANGAEEGDYIVSVVYNMKFSGVDEALPGMNVFYVQSDENGEIYINNRYSSFNRELQESKTKEDIITLMEEFENSDAIKKLQQEVQSEYDQKVAANEDLQKKLNEVAEAIANWKDSYTPPAEDEQQPEDSEQPDETQTDDSQQTDEQQTDDGQQTDEQQPEENTDDGSQDDGNTGLDYVPEGTVLTASDGYNVRTSMDQNSELIGTTAVGDSIKVILSYKEGWTKVEWNGTTGYIRTDLLLNN